MRDAVQILELENSKEYKIVKNRVYVWETKNSQQITSDKKYPRHRKKELTDSAIRNVKEFDRSAEVREDEGDAAYHAS